MYFQRFPFVEYNFGDNEANTIFPNITSYIDMIDQLKSEVAFYEKYTILDGDRPDVVSQKLYGTPDYHWTFFFMNDGLKARQSEDYLDDQILSEDNQKFSKATSSFRLTSISPAFLSRFAMIRASLIPFLFKDSPGWLSDLSCSVR